MPYQPRWIQEQKLNEVEIIKLEKDGLDVIETIVKKYSKEGYSSITPEDMNRFKWAGVYEQKPKNGYFMMRVRINSGIMNSIQAKTLAEIANEFGCGIANVTTRGAIQFHWIQVENLPDIFGKLKACGLSSFEACGDCPRVIVGNPLTGIDKDEWMDTTKIVEEVNELFLNNKDFSNLPRKFKISISSSIHNVSHAQINDLAFTPAIKRIHDKEIVGFHVWVGGGLSAMPHLGKRLNLFVKPEEVVKVAKGVCTIFRDYGYREKRTRARLKFLVADWGIQKFQEKLTELIGEMDSCGEDKTISWNAAYYYGVHLQKQEGFSYIGLHLPLGEITGDGLGKLSEIAENYGDGILRTTLSQNMIISGIENKKVNKVLKEEVFLNLSPNPNKFIGYTVSCTGMEYCNLAIVETKELARRVMHYLDEKYQLDTPLRIHFTGCPNSCGQKQIADISLQGALLKENEQNIQAFTLWLGGTLQGDGEFASNLNYRIKAEDVHLILEKIVIFFQEKKEKEESFHSFIKRIGIEEVRKIL